MKPFDFQLAKKGEEFPVGPGWVVEPKIDGVRMAVEVRRDGFRAFGREGALSLPAHIDALVELLGVPEGAVLDGEYSFGPDAASSYGVVGRSRPPRVGVFHVFDCLVPGMEGVELKTRKLWIMRRFKEHPCAPVLPVFWACFENTEEAYGHFCKEGYEGMVAKRLDSVYQGGRHASWLKFKP